MRPQHCLLANGRVIHSIKLKQQLQQPQAAKTVECALLDLPAGWSRTGTWATQSQGRQGRTSRWAAPPQRPRIWHGTALSWPGAARPRRPSCPACMSSPPTADPHGSSETHMTPHLFCKAAWPLVSRSARQCALGRPPGRGWYAGGSTEDVAPPGDVLLAGPQAQLPLSSPSNDVRGGRAHADVLQAAQRLDLGRGRARRAREGVGSLSQPASQPGLIGSSRRSSSERALLSLTCFPAPPTHTSCHPSSPPPIPPLPNPLHPAALPPQHTTHFASARRHVSMCARMAAFPQLP